MKRRQMVAFIVCIFLLATTLPFFAAASTKTTQLSGVTFEKNIPQERISALTAEELSVLQKEAKGPVIGLISEDYYETSSGQLAPLSTLAPAQARGVLPESKLKMTMSITREPDDGPRIVLKVVAMASWYVWHARPTDYMAITWNDVFVLRGYTTNDHYAYTYYQQYYYNSEVSGSTGFDYSRAFCKAPATNYLWYGHSLSADDKMLVTVAYVKQNESYGNPITFAPTAYYFHLSKKIDTTSVSVGLPPSISLPVNTSYDTASIYYPMDYE